jgi:hypothetical protein
MLDRLRSVLPFFAFALVPACAGTVSEDPAPSADTVGGVEHADNGGATPPSAPERVAGLGAVDTVGLAGPLDPAAGAAPTSPGDVALSVDGAACTVLRTSMIADGPLWTVQAQASCGVEVTLKIVGRLDARYPQTDLNPYRDLQAVTLDVWRDHHAYTLSTATEGRVDIARGPTSTAHAPVEGRAVVVNRGTAHELRFKLHY